MLVYVDIQMHPLLKGGIDRHVVNQNSSVLWLELHQNQHILGWHKIEKINSLVLDQ